MDAKPDVPLRGELRERTAATPGRGAGAVASPIEAMVIGANERSYLRRGGTFDVMRNVEAGVEDTGTSSDAGGRVV